MSTRSIRVCLQGMVNPVDAREMQVKMAGAFKRLDEQNGMGAPFILIAVAGPYKAELQNYVDECFEAARRLGMVV